LAPCGEGRRPHSPEKARPLPKDGSFEKDAATTKASTVSLIGQSAPLIVIALTLETATEWCLADETRRAEKP
jgi:hypothetical protein